MKFISAFSLLFIKVFLITSCGDTHENLTTNQTISDTANLDKNVKKPQLISDTLSTTILNVDQENKSNSKSKNITRIVVSSGNLSLSPPYQYARSFKINEKELSFGFTCGKEAPVYGKNMKLSKRFNKLFTIKYNNDGTISGNGKFQLNADDWNQVLKLVNAEKLVNQDAKDAMVGGSSSIIILYSGEEIIYSGDDATSNLSKNGSSVLDKVFSWSEKFIQNYRLP
jgi:hypothetical protein